MDFPKGVDFPGAGVGGLRGDGWSIESSLDCGEESFDVCSKIAILTMPTV